MKIFPLLACACVIAALAFFLIRGCLDFFQLEERQSSIYTRKLQDPIVLRYLGDWVDANMRYRETYSRVLVRPKRAGPGEWQVDLPFDWGAVGIDPHSKEKQIRLICDEADRPLSLFFGDGLRAGILVSLFGDFGVEQYTMIWSSGRFAVYCPSIGMRSIPHPAKPDPK